VFLTAEQGWGRSRGFLEKSSSLCSGIFPKNPAPPEHGLFLPVAMGTPAPQDGLI
jgi:hypothetical protein